MHVRKSHQVLQFGFDTRFSILEVVRLYATARISFSFIQGCLINSTNMYSIFDYVETEVSIVTPHEQKQRPLVEKSTSNYNCELLTSKTNSLYDSDVFKPSRWDHFLFRFFSSFFLLIAK